MKLVVLGAGDADPAVSTDRGVAMIAAADRLAQAPDRSLLLLDDGSLIGRCSCWWTGTPVYNERRTGVIGHYAAADSASARTLLWHACDLISSEGAATAIGPMDGTTWRRYRFIVERGPEPPFFMEPDNPDEYPSHWTDAGFSRIATYTSALNVDLTVEDPRTPAAFEQLRESGIVIRRFEFSRSAEELQRIFALSLEAFGRNFLYTPIDEREFLAQYQAVLPHVTPEVVLLAEKGAQLVGFMFAVPDLLEQRRMGTVQTILVKTVAVHPSVRGIGLGGVLVDMVQRKARELGFRRAVHALVHETNVSGRISARTAKTMRRYALFAKPV
jgi:GNAT superfamily N-acetyltransferase